MRDEADTANDSLVVDGVTLSLDTTLSSIRQAAESLGLGRSGGKSTVLKRIRDHLKKQSLIAAHEARQHLKDITTRDAKEQPAVSEPSGAERRRHCLTHLPYAPWCEACVSFRGKSDRRTERADDRRVDSELALDFCFTARADGDEKLCCLVVSDSHSKWVQAWPVKAKGGVAARNYITTEFVKCTRAEVRGTTVYASAILPQ